MSLDLVNVNYLREICRKSGKKGYSKLKRTELLALLPDPEAALQFLTIPSLKSILSPFPVSKYKKPELISLILLGNSVAERFSDSSEEEKSIEEDDPIPSTECGSGDGSESARPLRRTRTRAQIPKKLRVMVWNRWIGSQVGETACPLCRDTIIHQHSGWEASHVEPDSLGGALTLDNLRVLCCDCNRGMGARNLIEYAEAHHPESLPGLLTPPDPPITIPLPTLQRILKALHGELATRPVLEELTRLTSMEP